MSVQNSNAALDDGYQSPVTDAMAGGILPKIVFLAVLVGTAFVGYQLVSDVARSQSNVNWVLLIGALVIALAFEFVNGFHDTSNAVATVIYTRTLKPQLAVVWSGFWNFLGVMFASGAVAWGIVSLLPVELILQVGNGSGTAMVFALLSAAVIWNAGTWWLGLPASSSHTLIGSIIGVGLANQFLAQAGTVTSGVDWGKAQDAGKALLISPLIGFVASALLLLVLKFVFRNPMLYKTPVANQPPPWWIRVILMITCTGVSFAHGSNDGQKGMGLIMLILVGLVPAAFALNRAPNPELLAQFRNHAQAAVTVLDSKFAGVTPPADAREAVNEAVRHKKWGPTTGPALASYIREIDGNLKGMDSFAGVGRDNVTQMRNDLYVVGEALTLIDKKKQVPMSAEELKPIAEFHKSINTSTRFIPDWVKEAIALALGLGTMVGWKRIVVTVGEKIGKTHLSYGQGAAAEAVTWATISGADLLGLPVSTTHILNSGIAGTMAANGSGLQWGTVRSIVLAWVLTLPCAAALSALLFWLFRMMF